MLRGSCHCGAIQIEVDRKPRRLTSCNCSIAGVRVEFGVTTIAARSRSRLARKTSLCLGRQVSFAVSMCDLRLRALASDRARSDADGSEFSQLRSVNPRDNEDSQIRWCEHVEVLGLKAKQRDARECRERTR